MAFNTVALLALLAVESTTAWMPAAAGPPATSARSQGILRWAGGPAGVGDPQA